MCSVDSVSRWNLQNCDRLTRNLLGEEGNARNGLDVIVDELLELIEYGFESHLISGRPEVLELRTTLGLALIVDSDENSPAIAVRKCDDRSNDFSALIAIARNERLELDGLRFSAC